MGNFKLDSSVAADVAAQITDYSVDAMTTDGASDQKETTWNNAEWSQQLGYFKTICEINAVINVKSTWTVGKGFQADQFTTMLLSGIKGWGKDTFNTILENMIRTAHIGGDSYSEIVRDKKSKLPINIKPLDPASINIVADRAGLIIRYEQISKIKAPTKRFKPEQILHFSRNRVADEIHGVSIIDSLVNIILMRNEAMEGWKRVLQRNIDPLFIFHLDTDDPAEIATFKAKHDAAKGNHESMYIPKDSVVPELVATAANAILNPLTWIDSLNNYFYQAAGVPQIVVGGSGEFTEATAKIAYLAFQQTIEEEQLYIEEQIAIQLGMKIELEFPASLENDLLSDKKKDGGMATQPNETTAGAGQ